MLKENTKNPHYFFKDFVFKIKNHYGFKIQIKNDGVKSTLREKKKQKQSKDFKLDICSDLLSKTTVLQPSEMFQLLI